MFASVTMYGCHVLAVQPLKRARSVEICQVQGGTNVLTLHPHLCRELAELLAQLYEATGAYAKAEPLYQRAGVIEESNTRLFLLASSEARQQAYLQLRKGRTFARVFLQWPIPRLQAQRLA